ncbi:MAG: diguanylate cyclase [Chloroflexota bacterium]
MAHQNARAREAVLESMSDGVIVLDRRGVVVDINPAVRVTISLGVAALRADTVDFARLLADADHALYAAKRAGRNRALAFRA